MTAASAALAVQRRDLWLTEVCQNTLAAGGSSQRHTISGELTLSVISQQTVNVLQPGPTPAAPLKGPFVTNSKQIVFIRVFTLGKEKLFYTNYSGRYNCNCCYLGLMKVTAVVNNYPLK